MLRKRLRTVPSGSISVAKSIKARWTPYWETAIARRLMRAIVISSPVLRVCALAQLFFRSRQGNVSSKCNRWFNRKTDNREEHPEGISPPQSDSMPRPSKLSQELQPKLGDRRLQFR